MHIYAKIAGRTIDLFLFWGWVGGKKYLLCLFLLALTRVAGVWAILLAVAVEGAVYNVGQMHSFCACAAGQVKCDCERQETCTHDCCLVVKGWDLFACANPRRRWRKLRQKSRSASNLRQRRQGRLGVLFCRICLLVG